MREYSFYMRIAFATTMKCPIDYYSAPDEMWTPPEPGHPYTVDDLTTMIGRETGGEFPYPDSAVTGREEIPPAAPESVEQRQVVGAIQEAQTMESLRQVNVSLQAPQDVVIPSGESQSAEAAQMSQLKSGEKERVDFTQAVSYTHLTLPTILLV